MKTQTDKTQEPQKETVQRLQQESSTGGEATISDNRSAMAVQRKLRSSMGGANDTDNTIQRKNNTGLPDNLKSGIENLSGYSMDDVNVHYNSSKPAQLQAHAYAQGTDIHLAPGQEKHLPHEAWHVVQQKQGRVRPTMQFKGKVNINDDVSLEKEADVMGAKAMKGDTSSSQKLPKKGNTNKEVFQMVRKDYLVSMNDEKKIGSIYINDRDRLRLTHANGPSVEKTERKYKSVERFNIDVAGFMKSHPEIDREDITKEVKVILKEVVSKGEEIPFWAKRVDNVEEAIKLFDEFFNHEDRFLIEIKPRQNESTPGSHTSRGKLVKYSLDEDFVKWLEMKIAWIERDGDARKRLDEAYLHYRQTGSKNSQKIYKKIGEKMNRELLEAIHDKSFSFLYIVNEDPKIIHEIRKDKKEEQNL
ncbi:DUF4157 domain-containing protein [uncultured Aquimarina sp.]|uniref:eCIS core domain-containing protein n=1 Tax=uncultured Aquimarina sp. TaxID=575652 RepID=UPI0026187DB1|nr:DUF4157 domain-containing protein [uncultured Aquimarina sp.]